MIHFDCVNGQHENPTNDQVMLKWEEKCDQVRGLIGQTVLNSLQVSIDERDSVKTPNFPKNLKFLNLHIININVVN